MRFKFLFVSLLTVFAVSVLVVDVPASEGSPAETLSGTTGDCTWVLDGTELTISGTGEMADYSSGRNGPWGRSITSVMLSDGVKNVGEYAFYKCGSLRTVALGGSVAAVGEHAFADCGALVSITFGDSVSDIGDLAFANCISIRSLTFPDSMRSVGFYAFNNCSSLESVSFGSSLQSIDHYAFSGCSSLRSVLIPETVISIGQDVFHGCTSLEAITVPDSNLNYASEDGVLYDRGMTRIVQYPAGRQDITYTVPDTVTELGSMVFYKCDRLESLVVSAGVISIEDSAFVGCGRLGSITVSEDNPVFSSEDGVLFSKDRSELIIYPVMRPGESYTVPDTVTVIGPYAFNSSMTLLTLVIPSSVDAIEDGAFYLSGSLEYFIISDFNPNYSSEGGVLFSKDRSQLILYPAGRTDVSYTVPDTVTVIGEYAFNGMSALRDVVLPEGLLTIGKYAFNKCSSLEAVYVPDSVTRIGAGAFSGCTSLSLLSLGGSLVSIGTTAFSGCSSLRSVTLGDSVTSIGMGAFMDCTALSSVTFGGSLSSIGAFAFYSCAIETLEVLDSVITVDMYAFGLCRSLRSVVLGDSVTSIGGFAFSECTALSSVTFGSSITSVGEYAFDGIVFLATDGVTALDAVPEGLRGSVFMGADGVLVRQAVVTFDANGGSGVMETVYADALHPIWPVCGFTAPYGMEFVGWSLSAEGDVLTFPLTIAEDTVLYAVWSSKGSDGKVPALAAVVLVVLTIVVTVAAVSRR